MTTRTETVTRPRVAFALSGGGAHGAAQVGMLQALLAAGIEPDVVVGCSVGALNAVYVAADPTPAGAERLADLWRSLSRRDVFGSPHRRTLLNALARRDHVYENNALLRLIDRICPVRDLADLQVETHVVTTDLDAAHPVWWTRGPAHDILAASTCLPGVFAPVVLSGEHGASRHVDGGVCAPIPVAYAAALDVDVVYVLDVARGTAPAPARLNAMEVLLRSFSISRYANVPDADSVVRPGQEIVFLPSPDTFARDMRDFSYTARYIEESRTAAAEVLASRRAPVEGERGNWLQRRRRTAA
jgi:NTE family protein